MNTDSFYAGMLAELRKTADEQPPAPPKKHSWLAPALATGAGMGLGALGYHYLPQLMGGGAAASPTTPSTQQPDESMWHFVTHNPWLTAKTVIPGLGQGTYDMHKAVYSNALNDPASALYTAQGDAGLARGAYNLAAKTRVLSGPINSLEKTVQAKAPWLSGLPDKLNIKTPFNTWLSPHTPTLNHFFGYTGPRVGLGLAADEVSGISDIYQDLAGKTNEVGDRQGSTSAGIAQMAAPFIPGGSLAALGGQVGRAVIAGSTSAAANNSEQHGTLADFARQAVSMLRVADPAERLRNQQTLRDIMDSPSYKNLYNDVTNPGSYTRMGYMREDHDAPVTLHALDQIRRQIY